MDRAEKAIFTNSVCYMTAAEGFLSRNLDCIYSGKSCGKCGVSGITD